MCRFILSRESNRMNRLKKVIIYLSELQLPNKVLTGILVYGILVIIINYFTIAATVSAVNVVILIVINIAILLILYAVTIYVIKHNSKYVTIIIMAGSPIFLFFIIENVTGNLLTIEPLYWLINLAIVYLVQGMSILFCRRIKIGLICSYTLFLIAAVIEYYVYKLRGRSFMLQDIASIRTARDVMGGYTYELELRVGITLLCGIALLYIMIVLPEIAMNKFSKVRKACVILLGLFMCNVLMSRSTMSKVGFMNFNQWDIEGNYQKYGYIRTMLATVQYMKIEEPPRYSVDAAQQIAEEYRDETATEDLEQTIQPENIIMIMNESWADFRCISDYDQDDTITPYIDSLYENTIKGYLYVPVFGNGTANSEYEALTGNSMQFLDPANTAYQWYISETEWGLATTLKDQGYRALAFHPNTDANWNRKDVYPRMQFEEFFSLDNWPVSELDTIRWCPSDKSSYNKLISIQQNKNEGERLFLFLVTMQNHGGYVWEDYESTVTLNYDVDYPQTEQYLSLIRETDNAFEYLINYFGTVDEPTMVIMFGDHMPSVETEFYERLLGCSWSAMDEETKQKIYMTPFVVWTNYDIDEKAGVEMSSNYLSSYVLQIAGVDMPDYNKCILNFMQKIPVIGSGIIKDSQDVWYAWEDLPDDLSEVINDYQILQYNNVFGGRNRLDTVFAVSH